MPTCMANALVNAKYMRAMTMLCCNTAKAMRPKWATSPRSKLSKPRLKLQHEYGFGANLMATNTDNVMVVANAIAIVNTMAFVITPHNNG